MKKFDHKNPHFKMCVAKADAVERQKKVLARLEKELDDEIDRQHKLVVLREEAKKELEKKQAALKKTKK